MWYQKNEPYPRFLHHAVHFNLRQENCTNAAVSPSHYIKVVPADPN